jgi:hypothetical protein
VAEKCGQVRVRVGFIWQRLRKERFIAPPTGLQLTWCQLLWGFVNTADHMTIFLGVKMNGNEVHTIQKILICDMCDRPFSQLVPIILGQQIVTNRQSDWASKSLLKFINFELDWMSQSY